MRKFDPDYSFNVDEISNSMYQRLTSYEQNKALNRFMRHSLHRVLKPCEYPQTRSQDIEVDLGYTTDTLRIHLESLFHDGMSWDTYGLWVIDHILPVSTLVDMGEDDPKVVNALVNLMPMWSCENMQKGNRWLEDMTEKDFYEVIKTSLMM